MRRKLRTRAEFRVNGNGSSPMNADEKGPKGPFFMELRRRRAVRREHLARKVERAADEDARGVSQTYSCRDASAASTLGCTEVVSPTLAAIPATSSAGRAASWLWIGTAITWRASPAKLREEAARILGAEHAGDQDERRVVALAPDRPWRSASTRPPSRLCPPSSQSRAFRRQRRRRPCGEPLQPRRPLGRVSPASRRRSRTAEARPRGAPRSPFRHW